MLLFNFFLFFCLAGSPQCMNLEISSLVFQALSWRVSSYCLDGCSGSYAFKKWILTEFSMWAGNILCYSIKLVGEGVLLSFSCWTLPLGLSLTQALLWEIGRKLPVFTMRLLFKIAVNSRANGNQFKCDSWFEKELKDSGSSAMLKAFSLKE